MDTIILHIIPIVFTMLALGHVRSLAGRRSAIRESLATVGAVIIILGLSSKAIMLALMVRGTFDSTYGIGTAYALMATGFIFLLYGFLGWDRMTMARPNWSKPIIASMLMAGATLAGVRIWPNWWMLIPVSVVVGSLLVLDLMVMGYTLRQRYFIAVPFILLHMASIVINTLIEMQGHMLLPILQGIILTASTSALLFYINMRMIERHTYRGRMLIV